MGCGAVPPYSSVPPIPRRRTIWVLRLLFFGHSELALACFRLFVKLPNLLQLLSERLQTKTISKLNVDNGRVVNVGYLAGIRAEQPFRWLLNQRIKFPLVAGKSQPPALNSTRWNGRWTQ